MMTASIQYGLQGAFKVDVFDKEGKFVETTDWFSNFITQTGLLYPTIYSFANCFRYLTLGSDASTQNNGGQSDSSLATTGCYARIETYMADTDNGPEVQHGGWMGYEAYETGTLGNNSSCLTSLSDTGPTFYRAWSVPSGGGVVGDNVLSIGEFAVSPGNAYDETGRYAFSRVVRPLPLKRGYRAIVSYQLRINIKNSALTVLGSGTFETGNANVDTDADMIRQWKYLSGYYKQVWCGLSCVDNWGASFITKYGNGMEPSLTKFNDYYLYFSPDNSAFDVNAVSGGYQPTPSKSWTSDGIMVPLGSSSRGETLSLTPTRTDLGGAEAQTTLFYGPEQAWADVPTIVTPMNIRLGSDESPLKTPWLRDYKTNIRDYYSDTTFNYQSAGGRFVVASGEEISYANVGGSGINLFRGNVYNERSIMSSRIFRLPMDIAAYPQNTYPYRRKNISRKIIFSPASSLGYNTRFGSMVFAYRLPSESATPGNYTFYPTIDTLFYNTSGRSLLQHYRMISGIYFTQRGSGIVNATVSISGGAGNIARWSNLKTFQGPLSGYLSGTQYGDGYPWNLQSGDFSLNNKNTSGNWLFRNGSLGYSGWGGIYGVVAPRFDETLPYDMGIANHETGTLFDNNTGQLYWPNVYGNPLAVTFTNVVFSGYGGNIYSPDIYSKTDAELAASGFCRPKAVVYHFDVLGVTGARLLPNYGIANTIIDPTSETSDLYSPNYGGASPGFSLDNGMEIYLDIVWSSPCGAGTVNCNEPT